MTSSVGSARTILLAFSITIAILVWALRDVALLVGYAVLVAYALLPVVRALAAVSLPGGRHLPRRVAAAAVLLALLGVIGGALILAAPRVVADAEQFASSAPQVMDRMLQSLRAIAAERGLGDGLESLIRSVRTNSGDLLRGLGGTLAGAAARSIGGLSYLLGLAILPLLAFYLLADSAAVQSNALSFVPLPVRSEIVRLGRSVDRALSAYIRGQAVVCIVMGTAIGIVLSALHHPSAALLGAIAGLAEIIPFLGSAIAAIAIVLAGATVSWSHAVVGVLAYVIVNWVIGTFVTPRVMGRYLKLHPFVVTVSVLAGARLLGPAGALLALPGAAVIQAIIAELAEEDGSLVKNPSA